MATVTYDGKSFEMEDLRLAMDKDVLAQLDTGFPTDQQFFDSYLIAHEKKHGERFSVD